jgi:GT2 family glycosyltransferase
MNAGFSSVVVCTYNRLEYLKKCVQALLLLEGTDFEIVIVNDGSNDGTKEYLADIHSPLITVIHNEKNLGLSTARNKGIQASQGEYIAFTDDDCLPESNWLKNLLLGFTEPKVGFVIGETFYVNKDYHGYFPERLVKNKGARWPMGCNIAYRKKVFEQIGYFDDYFFAYNNEDSEMAIRAISFGWEYVRKPEAVVIHQAMDWSVKSLLRSAHNASVWPVLKKRYPNYYQRFGPPIVGGVMVNAKDYVCFLGLPLLIPILLVRYLMHGKKNIKIFFTKWPLWLILRRWYIYKEAVKNRVWMI